MKNQSLIQPLGLADIIIMILIIIIIIIIVLIIIISARPKQGVVLNFGFSILWNLAEPLQSKQSIQKKT